ncbi:hypothetical protein R1flu_029088 [Riccia fluitans]|uniref:Uncharacterized protein n=1 Tax=Riccia fluitans TaxID=41844 RepID=A0ABD1XNL8_9MARC
MLRFLMMLAFLLSILDLGAIVEATARGRFDVKSGIETSRIQDSLSFPQPVEHPPYMDTEWPTVEMRSRSSLSNKNKLLCGKSSRRCQVASVSPTRRVLDDSPVDKTPEAPHHAPHF